MPHTIWFTSDLHLGHSNIIRYDQRPYASVEDMTEALVANWNIRVKPGDTVYYLGDFSMTSQRALVDEWLSRLNGQLHLIVGNHDSKAVTRHKRWITVNDRKRIKNPWRKHRIVLDHFVPRAWWGSHHGAWALHGHTHGTLPDEGTLRLDVGTNSHNYAPISLEEVRVLMEQMEPDWRARRNKDPHVQSRRGR